MGLRFGLVLSNRNVVIGGSAVAELLELAELAEAAGWEDVWVGDSLGAKPRLEAISLLSAVAARTSKVRLGPACMATIPLRDPLLLAYQWCSLDLLSGGRTVFVACQGQGTPGEWRAEFEAFGVDPSSRTRRMVETIEILRLASGQAEASFSGEFTKFKNLPMQPRPVQQPIPVWIASSPNLRSARNVETAYRRVATTADGWMTIGKPADEVAQSLEIIRGYAKEAGRELGDGFESCLYFNVNLNDDADAAFNDAKGFMERYYGGDATRASLERTGAIGSASACIERIQALVDAGLTTLAVRFMSFDQPVQLRRFTEQVLPAFR